MCLRALHATSGKTCPVTWQWHHFTYLAVGNRIPYSSDLWSHVSMHSARHLLQLQLKSRLHYQPATTQAAYISCTCSKMLDSFQQKTPQSFCDQQALIPQELQQQACQMLCTQTHCITRYALDLRAAKGNLAYSSLPYRFSTAL